MANDTNERAVEKKKQKPKPSMPGAKNPRCLQFRLAIRANK